jgi:hypothetical protein
VFWQVGTSATLGSTTAFQGNLMALASISLNNAATVLGRMLARNGQVSLINNVLTAPGCAAGSTTSTTTAPTAGTTTRPGASTTTTPGASTTGAGSSPGGATPGATGSQPTGSTRNGSATLRRTSILRGTPLPATPSGGCTAGFRAAVRGRLIERVVFALDGRRIASRTRSPFQVLVNARPGAHRVTARVTFKDATRARTLTLRYRACAAAVLNPRRGPARFTG